MISKTPTYFTISNYTTKVSPLKFTCLHIGTYVKFVIVGWCSGFSLYHESFAYQNTAYTVCLVVILIWCIAIYFAPKFNLSSVDWEALLQKANNTEDNWTAFKNEVISATKKFIPTCVYKSCNHKFCWWAKSLALATKRKQELFLKFKQTHHNADYCEYAHQHNLTKAKHKGVVKKA